MAKEKVFKVDANALLTLGRNSIKDHTTAVVELIKNSYDADADTVLLEISARSERQGGIRIADNGHGMSEKDVEENWLRIGFSEKRAEKTTTTYLRRKTGEKGIGRLSADRLGSLLELKSKKVGCSATGLLVDWSKFEQPGQEVGQVKILSLESPTPIIPEKINGSPSKSGTELLISGLRQRWTGEDIKKLHEELSLLLPPYPELAKNFILRFKNDINTDLNGPVKYNSRVEGEIELKGVLHEDGSLHYQLHHYAPDDRKRRQTVTRTIPWAEIAPDPDRDGYVEDCKLGKLEVRLSFFVRKSDLLSGTGLSLSDLRDFLDRNAGVRIYRDMMRVKPYGDPTSPEADWLGLGDRKIRDPAGARRSSFKIAPNQLVGAVFAGRDSTPNLEDSSSREGLIENDAFRQLRVVLMRCVNIIEGKYHEINRDKPRQGTNASKAKAAVKTLSGSISNLSVELAGLQDRFSGEIGDEVEALQEQIQLFLEQAKSAKKDIEEIADQNTVFRGLATVGIASAIFGHETLIAIGQVTGKVIVAKKVLGNDPPEVGRAIERLDQAQRYMANVESWGKFALGRVNKDKRQRRRVSVSKLVNAILDELGGIIAESDIDLRRDVAEEIEARTFPMDVEAALINYLTNAYHEVKRHNTNRVIGVRLLRKKNGIRDGFEISVADSGGGIPPEYVDGIWEPLFSTKTDTRGKAAGTGLGLSIVKSAVEESGGMVGLSSDRELSGALFSAWFPKGE
jgi:signal transduction histidine kinase